MKNVFKRHIYPCLVFLMALLMTGCLDDTFSDYNDIIGKGDANIRATVEFKNLVPNDLNTRTPGDVVGDVSNLQMVIYKVEGGNTTFYKRIVCNSLPDYELTTQGNEAEPGDKETSNADKTNGDFVPTGERTDHADFSFEPLPYGRYKIYAVANVPSLTDEQCTTEETLKSIQFTWNTDVAKNNAMFGYFTLGDDQASSGFDAPIIIVNKKTVDIHAWIKRLVSKVTVSFDPSGLKEAVTVYVKSVTIKDIPLHCPLGKNNKPTSDAELIANGESINYYTAETANDYKKWDIILQKGTGPKGSDHSNKAQALFFFENMQGDYEGQKSYLKEQIPDETGVSVESPTYYGDGTMKNDFKDRVRYGTYVEVVAYYISKNAEKLSSGNIVYRFMLGKNITYNYNAQRNYHYKLTLKLRGFANEADWHIKYEEPTPIIYTPDPFNMSYLYGQYHGIPVRAKLPEGLNDQYYIVAEITENGWWPSEVKTGILPDQTVGKYNEVYGFAWNEMAYKNIYKDAKYAGFLSLRTPQSGDLYPEMGYGAATDLALSSYYDDKALGYAAYGLIEGEGFEVGYQDKDTHKFVASRPGGADPTTYSVKKDKTDGSVTVMMPAYTRQRKMATTTDFTGSNPFWAYTRTAKIKITLWTKDGKQVKFKDADDNSQEVWERIINIEQVRRIENPTAIYRRSNSTEKFDVTLLYLQSAAATEYTEVVSDGAWRVSILTDPQGLVKLTKGSQEVTNSSTKKYIEGSTGTKVEFTYQPRSEIGEKETRAAILLVEYHDYNCNHYIFLRQGYNAGVYLGNAKWSDYQVYATGQTPTNGNPQDLASVEVYVTRNPLSIGSMLKRCQYNYSIREANNKNHGWLERVDDKSLSVTHLVGKGTNATVDTKDIPYDSFSGYPWVETEAGKKFYQKNTTVPAPDTWAAGKRFTNSWAETWTTVIYQAGKKLTVPTAEQYLSLMRNCEFGYGVAYADGATAPNKNRDDSYQFTDDDNDDNKGAGSPKGVRACIAYNKSNGNNILFPMGSLSQGRRARQTYVNSNSSTSSNYVPGQTNQTEIKDPGAGSISYSGMRSLLYGKGNLYRPLTYNIYRSPGAIYWIKKPVLKDDKPDYASWDINYYTSMFNHYDYSSAGNWNGNYPNRTSVWYSNSLGYQLTWTGFTGSNSSDALPIKLIYQ